MNIGKQLNLGEQNKILQCMPGHMCKINPKVN